jgi:hypothetical protein
MKTFSFDSSDRAPEYERQGWIHVAGGATDEFCGYVQQFVEEAAADPLHGRGIGGAKDQLLLEFPPGFDLGAELLTPIALLAGLDPDRITISERHIKMYAAGADPAPRPHKDRFASQVAVGISIAIPPESHLVLFPDDATEVNPLLRAGLIDGLPPAELPERTLIGAREVVVFDQPGDVVAFPGRAVWHLRRQCASTIIVYVKCNDFGSDPLGEDPRTSARRAETARLLLDDRGFREAVPRLSARFESVTHEYGRDLERHWLNLNVWEEPTRIVSDAEFEVLRAVDDRCSVVELAAGMGSGAIERESVVTAVRRLTELGALDLSAPGVEPVGTS